MPFANKKKPQSLPIKTSYTTKVPGLEVRHNGNGERYTLGTINRDSVVLVDNQGRETEIDNEEFEDKFSLN